MSRQGAGMQAKKTRRFSRCSQPFHWTGLDACAVGTQRRELPELKREKRGAGVTRAVVRQTFKSSEE